MSQHADINNFQIRIVGLINSNQEKSQHADINNYQMRIVGLNNPSHKSQDINSNFHQIAV